MTLLTLNQRQIKEVEHRTKDIQGADLLLGLFKFLPKVERTDLIVDQFNTRDAMRILNDGYATGCTDFCIVYCALLKTLNISYTYIEVLEKRWLEAPITEKKVMGHCFVGTQGLLVDPQRKILYADQAFVLQRYEIFGKGNEPHDLGLTDFQTNMEAYMKFKETYVAERDAQQVSTKEKQV